MSTLDRNAINQRKNQLIPTNNNEEVSAEDVRAIFTDLNDSKFNLLDDDLTSVKDSLTDIFPVKDNILDKLLSLIGGVTRKLFFVRLDRVDSGQTTQTANQNNVRSNVSGRDVIVSNLSVSNTQAFNPNNRIVINVGNPTGYTINRVEAIADGTLFNYTVNDLQVNGSEVSFRLTRDNPNDAVGAVIFDFYGVRNFVDTSGYLTEE